MQCQLCDNESHAGGSFCSACFELIIASPPEDYMIPDRYIHISGEEVMRKAKQDLFRRLVYALYREMDRRWRRKGDLGFVLQDFVSAVSDIGAILETNRRKTV